MSGSAGQLTFKRIAGRTIVSEKATVVNNPRTSAQQRHRMKWPNLIQMYSGISPLLNCAFEGKAAGLSDYNMFVKLNFGNSTVYLTKSEAAAKSIVAAPYIITSGSLGSIETTEAAGGSVTDIALGALSIDGNTTVGDFAKAVVNNNANYNFGDQIAFIQVVQTVNPITGYPQCLFQGDRVQLEKQSEAKLHDVVSAAGFSVKDGKLACSLASGFQGAYAWVHSRKENGATRVSTQQLEVKSDLYADYSNEEAYQRAVKSYGGENNNFLTPLANGSATGNAGTGSGGENGGSSSGSSSGGDSGGSSSGGQGGSGGVTEGDDGEVIM